MNKAEEILLKHFGRPGTAFSTKEINNNKEILNAITEALESSNTTSSSVKEETEECEHFYSKGVWSFVEDGEDISMDGIWCVKCYAPKEQLKEETVTELIDKVHEKVVGEETGTKTAEECTCSVCQNQRFDTTFLGICETVKKNLSHLPNSDGLSTQESISSTIYCMFEACPDYTVETIIQQSNAAAQAILEQYANCEQIVSSENIEQKFISLVLAIQKIFHEDTHDSYYAETQAILKLLTEHGFLSILSTRN